MSPHLLVSLGSSFGSRDVLSEGNADLPSVHVQLEGEQKKVSMKTVNKGDEGG